MGRSERSASLHSRVSFNLLVACPDRVLAVPLFRPAQRLPAGET